MNEESQLPRFSFVLSSELAKNHELRTPNESINQRNLKIWADVADKTCLRMWEWIFGCAVEAISSPDVRSPCQRLNTNEKTLKRFSTVFCEFV